MKLEQYLDEINTFLINYLENAHADKYIIGLSGGVDSSLCAVLAKKAVGKDKLLGVIIPIESHPDDQKDAIMLCEHFDIDYVLIDASDIFHQYVQITAKNGFIFNKETLGNLKARIRMSILYAISQDQHGLVIGTDNADERYTGYFTKYGDGACDLLPIAYLLKNEVIKSAKLLGISDYLAERIPSAGLYEGQSDEKEMGISYEDLDNFLLGKKIDEKALEKIEHLHKISTHKIDPIPTPKPFNRD